MKGQAFVVFKDVQQASEAMRGLQKMSFFDRELDIHYAKNKSDAIAKREGQYNMLGGKRKKQLAAKRAAANGEVKQPPAKIEAKHEGKEEGEEPAPVQLLSSRHSRMRRRATF